MKTALFQSCGHCWVFQICWHIECSTSTASSFRIWNSSTEIPSPPLALFAAMLPKAHLTSHFRMSGSTWVITPLWLSGSWKFFCVSFFFFFAVPCLFVNFFSLVSFVLEHFLYSELGKLHSCSKSSFLLLNLSLLYKVVRSKRMIQVLLLFCLLHTVFLILQEYFIDELYVLPSFSLSYIISRYFVFIFVCFVSLDVKLISGSSFHVPVSFMIKSYINLPPNSFIFLWWCY